MDAVDSSEAPKDVVQRILKHTTSEDTLLVGLSQLLRAVHRGGPEGSEVLQCYLEESSECREILRYLQWERQRQSSDGILLCFRLLEELLLYTASTGGQLHSAGTSLVQRILQQSMRVVYAGLAGGPSNSAKLASSTLKLLTAMVAQNVGCARDVLAVFDFLCKPLERLPLQQKGSKHKDSARRCFINFALSFLVVGDADVIHGILNLKGFLSSVLKHLYKDPEEVAATVLTVVKEKAVQNLEISKRAKSLFFTSAVLESMAQFLIQGEGGVQLVAQDDEQGGVPLSVLCFHLLTQLCTNFQIGVCYRSKWSQVTERRSNNPVLLSFIQSLTLHLDKPLVQRLIISTVAACPDLLLPYMRTLPFSLEPRLSSKWVNSVDFIVKLYTALSPADQLHGPVNTITASDGSHPQEDGSSGRSTTVLGYCLPPPFTRSNLSVGIQNPSSLVKHLSLAVVALSLQRAAALLDATTTNASKDIEREAFRDSVLRSLPDIKTVIALHHNLVKGGKVGAQAVSGGSEAPPELWLRSEELSKGQTLLVQVLDVMNGYLRISPMAFVQAGFDLGKLLSSFTALPTATQEVEEVIWKKILVLLTNAPKGTLKWHHRGSNLLQFVMELVFHTEPTISHAAALLLHKVLQECPLLEELPAEVMLFVGALQQHAMHQLTGSDDTSEVASFLASAFLQLTHSSTFQSEITVKMGVDLSIPDVERATRVVGVIPCVLMMRMLSMQKVTGLVLLGELLQRCLHQAACTSTMAVTLLSLLESQDWLELVKGSHNQSVLHYQQLLVRYLSAWGGGVTHAGGRPCEEEDCHQGRALKKRLKKLTKTRQCSADLPTSLILAEILATSPSALAVELPGAYKWMVEQLPQAAVVAVDHFLTFFPSLLAPLASDPELGAIIPVSLVLKSKLLGWSLLSGNDDETPPLSKRRRHDHRDVAGTSPSPFSPSGLLEEMLSDEAFQPQVIAATNHTISQTDLTHSVHVLRSLLLLALSKLEKGAAGVASDVQAAVTVIVTLMKALFSKLNDLWIQDRTEAKRSKTPSVGDDLSEVLDGVFSPSLLSVPFWFASKASTEDTGLSSSGKKRQQKHLTVNAKHAGLQMAELLAFCAHLCPPWKTSQTFQALLRQSTAGLEGQLPASSCSIIKVLFPLMEVEQKLNVIDTLVGVCINCVGDGGRQQPVVDLLLSILPKAEHANACGSSGREDEMATRELADVGHHEEGIETLSLCISPSSLEKAIEAVTTETAKSRTSCRLEAVLEAVFAALLSPSLGASECSGKATELAVRKTARSILQVLEHSDRVSPTILPPLLSQQSLSSLAFSRGHPAHLILDSVSEGALQTYFQQCLKWPSSSRVRTASLLFHHLPALQTWLSSNEGVALLKNVLSTAVQDNTLGHLLPFVKAYLEVISTCSAVNSTDIFACLEEVVWGTCSELFLQARGEDEEQVAGEVLILIVKGAQKKRLKKTQKRLMKTLLAAREGETVWSRLHLEVLKALIPLAAVNKPTLLFASAAQIISDLHTNLVESSKPVASASMEAVLCSAGSLALTHCQLCYKEGRMVVQLDRFGGKDRFAHVYNSLIKCILKSHFLSHVHLDFLCSLVTFVNCAKNSIKGSDVIPGSMITQMTWSHSRFLDVLLGNLEPDPPPAILQAKDAVVHLLVAALPAAELIPSHCPILLAAYQATLSTTDRGILYMLSQYEASGVKMADFSPFMWGKPALEHYQSKQKLGWLLWKQPSMQEVLSCFRRDKMFQSVTLFPLDKSLEPANPYDNSFHGNNYKDNSVYDPSFLLPFFDHHLRPGAIVDCRRFIESGCWSYLLSALASSCAEVRAASYHCLIQFRGHLEGARFREKTQVVMVMSLLQNSITEGNQQLSSVHAQLFSKLSQLFLKPDNELYSILGNLVVYKPALDLSTVPLVNLLFYSSSPVAKSERSWILKILVDGLRTEEDYLLYKRHGVFTSAMAFWESAVSDPQAKGLILQLLDMAVQLRVALVDLVKRRDLFGWIHRGLQSTRDHHYRQPGRWASLLQLACTTWEHWLHLTEANRDTAHLPYPHITYQAALILQNLQQHSSPGMSHSRLQ